MSNAILDTVASNLQATQPQGPGPGVSGCLEAMEGTALMAQAMNDMQVAWANMLNGINNSRQTNMTNMEAVLQYCMGTAEPQTSATVPGTNPPIVLANFPGGIGYWSNQLKGASKSDDINKDQAQLGAANSYYQNENTLYNTADTAFSTMSNTSQTTLTGLSPAEQNLLANTKSLIDLWSSISSMISSVSIG